MNRVALLEAWRRSFAGQPDALGAIEKRLEELRERMVFLGSRQGKLYHGFVRKELLNALGMSFGCLQQVSRGVTPLPLVGYNRREVGGLSFKREGR